MKRRKATAKASENYYKIKYLDLSAEKVPEINMMHKLLFLMTKTKYSTGLRRVEVSLSS